MPLKAVTQLQKQDLGKVTLLPKNLFCNLKPTKNNKHHPSGFLSGEQQLTS